MNDPRRALVLAGGGLKVAYQAGVLQVWLDEAGLEMQLGTGASGGTFNLAMWCQGYSGGEIADAWRNYRPLAAATPNLRALLHGPFSPSVLTARGLRREVFPAFGLDWHAIRTTKREAAFDLFDVSEQEHRVLEPAELTEDGLVSAVALPWWFPPVRFRFSTWIDAVFATDANLDEAIRRGADELWIVWTVSTTGRWRNGFVRGYFQMIEAMANANLRTALRRIEESNAEWATGRCGSYPRHVTVHVLAAEVPLHYLLVLRRDRFARAVDLGVRDARAWCAERGIPTKSPPEAAPIPADRSRGQGISFRERMSGRVRTTETPRSSRGKVSLELEIVTDDVRRLAADASHTLNVRGYVIWPALGGRLPVRAGTLQLLTERDPGDLRMVYELDITVPTHRTVRVRGEKFVRHNSPLELWRDTTTLHVTAHEDEEEIAAGVLHLSVFGFARLLASIRGDASSRIRSLSAITRFADFFVGRLALARPRPPIRPAPVWLQGEGSS